ncbi:proline-rich protein 36-like [Simochromis diagramma]|uniref:proline-rich protein 36-like n=1 Tax=Simochromis diagramma TaxID=43689 RepID=UPI001A7E9C9A|nr:proline-rich protein 36-like [Simochromis diagramma]
MTRPVPRRHAFDPADSDLFERQDAALSIWAEKLRWKQRFFSEREHVFEGTRLALGGPRGRRVFPPAASTASEHSPRRVGVAGQASAARSPATPLFARPPAALLTGPSTSPWHGGSASHLGSMEAPVPEARLCTPPAASSRRRRHTRRHNMDCFQMVSSSNCLPPSTFDSSLKTNSKLIPDPWGVSLLEEDVDWEEFFSSAPSELGFIKDNIRTSTPSTTVQLKTVNSGGRRTRIIPEKPSSTTHPVTVSTPIIQPFPTSAAAQIWPSSSAVSPPQRTRAQPTPTPVPAPRRRAAAIQSTSTPAPVSRVGVTGVQPPSVPVPAPRLRATRTQLDLPGGLEELTGPPATSPLHPPPDPAFHALALSLVRLAEVSPAQAPALLAQAVALSPCLAQSLAQPSATPTSAPSSASPTSVHPLASPLQSVPSPAVQLPLQSPVVQSPALQSPVVQSAPALQSPVVQSPPALQSPVVQSPPVLQSVVQSPVHHPVQFPDLQPQHPEPAVSYLASQPGVSAPAGPAASLPEVPAPAGSVLCVPGAPVPTGSETVFAGGPEEPVQPHASSAGGPEEPVLRRLPRRLLQLLLGCLLLVAGVVDHRTGSVAAAVFLAAAHRIDFSVSAGRVAAHLNCMGSATGRVAAHLNCMGSATGRVAARLNWLCVDSVPPS